MQFTIPQTEAINHLSGPCLVLAGPGSGKTAVLTRRIRQLISSQIAPESILVITFTKASALEMKERFRGLMDDEDCPVTFGTFHSCFYGILRQEKKLNNNALLLGERKLEIIKEAVSVLKKKNMESEELYLNLAAEFSFVKNTLSWDQEDYVSTNLAKEDFRTVYRQYEEIKKKYRLIDFDDMLLQTYELFLNKPGVLEKWQKRFKFILIDEAQDMNDLQYRIVKLLAGRKRNVFIVGDDDQSIYGFRGANPEIMQKFAREFAGCKTIVLDRNFRCPANVVSLSKSLIVKNQERFEKEISAERGRGHVEVITAPERGEQHELVVKKICELKALGEDYRDMAVLYRNNIQGQYMIRKLLKAQVPFFLKDNLPNIYSHSIFMDLCCYFKVASGNHGRAELLRIINRPARYIQRASLENEKDTLAGCLFYYQGVDFMEQRIEALICDLQLIAKLSPFAAANYIKKAMGYEQFIKQEAQNHGSQDKEEIDEIFALFDDIARESKTLTEAVRRIEELRFEVDLLNERKSKVRGNQVGLYTLHGSKGLEFKNCFIIDVNEGMIPSKKALTRETMEEERRLFYVGLTRTKEKLFLCLTQKKNQEDLKPSRFLSELGIEAYSSSSPKASS